MLKAIRFEGSLISGGGRFIRRISFGMGNKDFEKTIRILYNSYRRLDVKT